MTDPAPISIYLQIAEARRDQFLALLFLASCREFLRNPIRQVVVTAQEDENLTFLKREGTLLEGLPIQFETRASLSEIAFEAPCLIATPAYFFSRDAELSAAFAQRTESGALSFITTEGEQPNITGAIPDGLLAFGDCLTNNGLITSSNLPNHSHEEIARIQRAFRAAFRNRAFWNYRYETNPALGSGVGSRGRYASLKRRILNDFIVQPKFSVLDVGCGDLMVVKDLPFAGYAGIDVSETAIANCRALRPEWTFHLGSTQDVNPRKADVVLCLDVLIHQPTIQEARKLLAFLSKHALRRIIVTGYDAPVKSSHIVYFHAPLKALLQELDGWKTPEWIASYHNMSVYVMDRAGTEDDPLFPVVSTPIKTQQRPIVTITVNTFNNRDQICRCLESIKRQTETKIEVHIIDDCSTDDTPERIAKIVQGDPRFQYVHDGKNKGISARRNQGLRLGLGLYHMFVDGDDWLPDDGVAHLVDLATESGADLVRGSHMLYNLRGRQEFEINTKDQMHHPEIRGVKLSDFPSLTMLWTSWNILFHRRLVSENYLRFAEELRLGEDRIFMLEAFMVANSITLTKDVTYFWDRTIKIGGNLSLSQNPEFRLLAIERWLEASRSDSTFSPRHRELIQVASFHEVVNILASHKEMPETLFLRYRRVLEAMDFSPHLLHDQSIKGWHPENQTMNEQILEDLRAQSRSFSMNPI